MIDLLHRHREWPRVEIGHARVASVAIALTALAVLAILTPPGLTLGWVGIDTVAIGVAYAAAVAWMGRSPTGRFGESEVLPVPTGWTQPGRGALRPAVLRFAAAGAVILVSAPAPAYSGRNIAEATGMGEAFVGTAFLALSTSLTELVASIAAVRIGAHNLAMGNVFGSNAFNMAALVLVDAAYTPAALLGSVDPS